MFTVEKNVQGEVVLVEFENDVRNTKLFSSGARNIYVVTFLPKRTP